MGVERGSWAGEVGLVGRARDRDLVLELVEERRRRCRGRDDLVLERRLRRRERWWAGLGRRERRSGERGARDCGFEVTSLGGGCGGCEMTGGGGSLL